MRLYYMPGACSLSPHIVAREAGIPLDMIEVGRDKKLPDGRDFRTINPNGYVPALELDDGTVLTEGPSIVQYLADLVPELELAPPAGSIQRYQLMSWLGFINSELHKPFGAFFNPKTPDPWKTMTREKLTERFAYVDRHLAGRRHVMGEAFTVADAYLFVILRWALAMGFDFAAWPDLRRFHELVMQRPTVDAALDYEKLDKKHAA
jgi:glutathione S-transferase